MPVNVFTQLIFAFINWTFFNYFIPQDTAYGVREQTIETIALRQNIQYHIFLSAFLEVK